MRKANWANAKLIEIPMIKSDTNALSDFAKPIEARRTATKVTYLYLAD
jgi:hypothetical protein